MIARDLDAGKFVPVAAFDFVSDDFFGALPVAFGLRVFGDGGVVDFGVEISVALESLANISPALFEKIDVYRAFLIDGDKLFKLAVGNFYSGDDDLDLRAFGDVHFERYCVRGFVVGTAANRRARVEMAFLDEKIVDAIGAALDALRSNRLPDFHVEALQDFFVGVFGAVGQLDGLQTRARARVHGHDHVHFVCVEMRNRLDGNFRLVQTFVVQSFREARDTIVNRFLAIGLAERERHRGGRGRVGRRRNHAANDYLVEEELLAHHEIDPDTACVVGLGHRDVGIRAGAVERADAVGNLVAFEGLANLDGNAGR